MSKKSSGDAKPKKRGAPTLKFTARMKARICRDVALGKSLRKVLKAAGMPKMTRVMEELQRDETFAKQYARARTQGIELHIDGIIDLADTATDKNAQAVRLQVDTRKWLASKLVPRVYGDKIELSGEVATPAANPTMTLDVARRLAHVLALGGYELAKNAPKPALPKPAVEPQPASTEIEINPLDQVKRHHDFATKYAEQVHASPEHRGSRREHFDD